MQAIIFDLDGTLADTIEDLGGAVNRALARRGLPEHAPDEYKLLVGNGFRNLAAQALPEDMRKDALIDEFKAEAEADYAERCLELTRPYPGIPELLDALEKLGLPFAVLSNKPQELTLKTVEGLFPRARFAVVRGEGPPFPRKPDPASALDIASRLGSDPGSTIFLGDSNVDMKTALAAGMRPIGASWGFRGEAELRAAGAELVLGTPLELLGLL
ncbi:MAG: HAD family hydrolase, partial [Spirochaetaceae bacterium]|nr:HAD family hydrolase [Spirochaetaceae bacterium]